MVSQASFKDLNPEVFVFWKAAGLACLIFFKYFALVNAIAAEKLPSTKPVEPRYRSIDAVSVADTLPPPNGNRSLIKFSTTDLPALFAPTKKFIPAKGAIYCVSGPMPR
ncbi:MAG: hypothetical protein II336_03035 [Loktanella sp.]|nr:hypothetical protein [Loktanella sp.]